MLTLYVDDSGSHVADKRLFLAGYILEEQQWQAFNIDWTAALAHGKPLTTLHMTQSFNGWLPRERWEKLRLLSSVVSKYRPISVEVSLSALHYKEIVGPTSPHDLRHPYLACFYALIITAARLVDRLGLQVPLNFVFDNQGSVGREAVVWYEPIRQMQVRSIQCLLGGPPVFCDDDNEPGLQAADMLVWHRRLLTEARCTDEQRAFADSIIFTHGVAEISEEMLRYWASEFAAMPGSDETKGKRGSVTKSVAEVLSAVPNSDALAILQQLEKRAKKLRPLKNFLFRVKMHRLWERISKRKIKLR